MINHLNLLTPVVFSIDRPYNHVHSILIMQLSFDYPCTPSFNFQFTFFFQHKCGQHHILQLSCTELDVFVYYCRYPRTQCLALDYILKFISHKASFKDVYRESGILALLINALKTICDEVKDNKLNKSGRNAQFQSILKESYYFFLFYTCRIT